MNNDVFLATEPRNLVTFVMIVMVTISSSVINTNHNDTEIIKAAENEKKSRFLHTSLPFPRFKEKTEGVSVV